MFIGEGKEMYSISWIKGDGYSWGWLHAFQRKTLVASLETEGYKSGFRVKMVNYLMRELILRN